MGRSARRKLRGDNLADLYRQPTAMIVSRAALLSFAGRCGLHYALGLTLTRLKHMPMFLPWRCITGRSHEAMIVLKENLARHADDRDVTPEI